MESGRRRRDGQAVGRWAGAGADRLGEAEAGGEEEGLPHGHLRVEDVLLPGRARARMGVTDPPAPSPVTHGGAGGVGQDEGGGVGGGGVRLTAYSS